jgi:hypothetical protein
MDAYVELARAEQPGREWEPMRVHLSGCPACAEEAESLLALLAADEA